jgi:hypothetical protein
MIARIGKQKFLLVALLAAAAQTQVPTASAAHVSRCSDGGGTEIYTDGSCRALGAEAVPMNPELLRDLMHSGGMDGQLLAPAPAQADNSMQSRLAHPRVASCSRTPAELAAALRGSLGTGDVNQLATVYDWTGVSATAAKPMMQRLERMSRSPLTSGYYFNANDGVVQMVQGTSTVSEFSVTRRAGCLFLQF